jgi:Uri superfamily endonuclease
MAVFLSDKSAQGSFDFKYVFPGNISSVGAVVAEKIVRHFENAFQVFWFVDDLRNPCSNTIYDVVEFMIFRKEKHRELSLGFLKIGNEVQI